MTSSMPWTATQFFIFSHQILKKDMQSCVYWLVHEIVNFHQTEENNDNGGDDEASQSDSVANDTNGNQQRVCSDN